MDQELRGLDPEIVVTEELDPAEGPERIARHGANELACQLAVSETAERQAQRLNEALQQVARSEHGAGVRRLAAVHSRRRRLAVSGF